MPRSSFFLLPLAYPLTFELNFPNRDLKMPSQGEASPAENSVGTCSHPMTVGSCMENLL